MKQIIKETLFLISMVLFANALLVGWSDLDQTLANELTKILLISLFIQPWVIYQFTH